MKRVYQFIFLGCLTVFCSKLNAQSYSILTSKDSTAIDSLEHSLSLDSGNAQAWHNLGRVYYQRVVSLIEAMHYDGYSPPGQLASIMGGFDKSLIYGQKAEALGKYDEEVLDLLIGAYFGTNNIAKSEEYQMKLAAYKAQVRWRKQLDSLILDSCNLESLLTARSMDSSNPSVYYLIAKYYRNKASEIALTLNENDRTQDSIALKDSFIAAITNGRQAEQLGKYDAALLELLSKSYAGLHDNLMSEVYEKKLENLQSDSLNSNR